VISYKILTLAGAHRAFSTPICGSDIKENFLDPIHHLNLLGSKEADGFSKKDVMRAPIARVIVFEDFALIYVS
jgi:hypothetical protein